MKLLRSDREFILWWRGESACESDLPREYPCWAWQDTNGKYGLYLYRSDLERMLEEMNGA
jgi:hypothetical protein